ncbi:serine/threonine-protein kinase [Nostoc sp. 'Peltigera membranacea cyanobiont' 232]|uniref:serine/threonine-protein kinase n=1 Tax=Nostoc sp. 'Peltigera membranacea cyanobiont' 232 TaxID=2014531 RepID=UPI000B954BFC|nr:serine/threonine-protein kinase [Nostoc sp. 'Peltigera membranacea cyanobiont' 232]OYE01483.1 serine/threonine protein kinase [Nostoc sp. 'Peltigera membranacea cyanobiont' 232]
MSYCTNIDCLRPQNSETSRFCNSCGQELLLKQRYRPLAVIGRGGFGITFLAIDEHLPEQPKCAIKQLCFQEENIAVWHKAVKLFHEEALHLNELKHSQIPKLLAQFEQNKKFYIVEELVDGQTLAQELQQQGVFQEPQIWEILKSLLLTLQFVHSRQVIHRDIKPENIMRRSVRGDLVLIDFGVAKLATNTRQLRTGTIVGSPEYIAPEQMRGKALPASDLYSLGVTCIYLLTNVSPFDLFDITNDCWVWQKNLPANNTVSLHLCEILDKLLQNAVSQRFQSATEVLQTLEQQPKKLLNISNYQTVSTIDYTNLRGLLAKGKWQSADRETWELMSQALAKPRGSYIFSSDLEKIPCPDLQTIDHLWVNSSHGRFGFSVQTLIYKNVNGDYGIFCHQVGWYIYNYTSANSEFDFSLKAPIGHLPSHIWIGGSQPWRYPNALALKLAACSINL